MHGGTFPWQIEAAAPNTPRAMNNATATLPNLSALKMDTLVPTEAPEGQKRKRSDDDSHVPSKAFKAHMPCPDTYPLSNLYGPVEWAFQRSKFKPGSVVFNFLLKGESGVFDNEQLFREACKGMNFDLGDKKSYIKINGDIATGLLATLTKLLVTNPKSPDAKKRLVYMLKNMNQNEEAERLNALKGAKAIEYMVEWNGDNVLPNTTAEEKVELMRTLIKQKYTADPNDPNYKYTKVLLKSGNCLLHEPGRGKGSLWESGKVRDPPPGVVDDNPNRLSNQLGMLLMERRAELRAIAQADSGP